MTEKEKMLASNLYNPSDEELVKLRLNARILTEKFNKSSVVSLRERSDILKQLLAPLVIKSISNRHLIVIMVIFMLEKNFYANTIVSFLMYVR